VVLAPHHGDTPFGSGSQMALGGGTTNLGPVTQ